ncbi:MAG TPA: hypothetical protein VN873_16260 [Candidatus Angelobacter sp.]|nr:hypothetical protein [Candidatus Angelobacter sp.]
MSTGNAGGYFEFFPEELIPSGIQLALDAWAKLPAAHKSGKEDFITGKFAAAMKREKKARRLSFSIHFQAIPLAADGPVAARIDFKFLAGFDEDAYFAFEAKRLRIPRKSKIDLNTRAYVGAEGMERFVTGKYAPGQFHGAMLGYVMDGDISSAMSAVQALVNSSRQKLRVVADAGWEKSRFVPSHKNIRQTRHQRGLATSGNESLTLQHIFLTA